MKKTSLEARDPEHLERARRTGAGCSADGVRRGRHHAAADVGGTHRRNGAGRARGPGEATVHALSGRVRLSAGDVARKDAHRYLHSNP